MDAFEHKGRYVLVLDRAEYETMVNNVCEDTVIGFRDRVSSSAVYNQEQSAFGLLELYDALLKMDPVLNERLLCED